MHNEIFHDDAWYAMTPEYIVGAMWERTGRTDLFKDDGSRGFQEGMRLERECQHIRDGVDLLTREPRGLRFGPALHPLDAVEGMVRIEGGPKASWLRYRLELLTVSGAFEAYDEGFTTAASLNRRLTEKGVIMKRSDCELAVRRRAYEDNRDNVRWNRDGWTFDDERKAQAEALREPERRLLETLVEFERVYWTGSCFSEAVSRVAGKSDGWAAATALKMKRKGLDWMLRTTGNGYIHSNMGGRTAYDYLRELDRKAALEVAHGIAPKP